MKYYTIHTHLNIGNKSYLRYLNPMYTEIVMRDTSGWVCNKSYNGLGMQ